MAAAIPFPAANHPPGARRSRTVSGAVEGEELVVQLPVSDEQRQKEAERRQQTAMALQSALVQ
jgi:hypothetical protein